MKLSAPENEAYAATIVSFDTDFPLENADNLVGARFFGYTAAIPKSYVHDLYVMFPAEAQLSHEYCHENNLYRHGHLNKDEGKSGYIEDNRRIRAIKLRGNTSNCIIMPLESLAYTGVDVREFKAGDTFDKLNGHDICQKYVVKTKEPRAKTQVAKVSRVDDRLLPKHFKTPQYWRHESEFNGKLVTVTQKLHGTSVRIAHIPVAKKLTWIERLAKKFGAKIKDQEYDYVFGTRNVIKDPNNPSQNSFYENDIHTQVGQRVKDALPKNYIIYGEIIGWENKQKPIQPHYTYNLKPGNQELYVYRVAVINPDGVMVDLSWDAMREFCKEKGLNIVPLLWRGWSRELDVDQFMNRNYYVDGFKNAIPLSNHKTKDEGVCVRYEDQIPVIAKAKCSEFLEIETRVLDQGIADIEEES